MPQIVIADACLLLERGPVTGTGFVEEDYEVVDGLGFGGDLTEGDTCASEGGSIL